MQTNNDQHVYVLAAHLVKAHEQLTGVRMTSELRLHKLMYFSLKESLTYSDTPLFESEIQGWQHGPVIVPLRKFFDTDLNNIFPNGLPEITESSQSILDNVVQMYAPLADWTVADISHKEQPWLNSRIGLTKTQHGKNQITIESIVSCIRDTHRPYNKLFDMYYDEFDDYNPNDFE